MGTSYTTHVSAVLDPTRKTASADLSAKQFHAVAPDAATTVAVSTSFGYGLLANAPESGDQASIVIFGCAKGKLGGTVKPGDILMATTGGELIVVALADAAPAEGFCVALEAGVDDDVIWVFVNGRNPQYVDDGGGSLSDAGALATAY
tara:strand:- start:252 stop:695 length:444 start_codon:yes stop_codon:yes gene_type:complete